MCDYLVFHWMDIVEKRLPKAMCLEKRWKGGWSYRGTVNKRGDKKSSAHYLRNSWGMQWKIWV